MIIELFKQITKIPRCSGTHTPFINFIQEFSDKYNYICDIDEAKNILCYKQNHTPTLCLQSHYDIVCLEDGKIPEILILDGYLTAKDSTLGADNGIGCAYMLKLMSENENCEFLFTCDEEIGLIGANNINLELKSKHMLNLDSEQEGEICIGCAGGVDIFATNTNSKLIQNINNHNLYEISIDKLDGGHSGVDIDKNIPNAIKLLAKSIKECDGTLLDISGGERINSIAKSAKAIIVSAKTPQPTHNNMKIEKIDTVTEHYKQLDKKIIDFIYSFSDAVRGYDKELNVVSTSINLSLISTNIDDVSIELSARAMDNEELKNITLETIALLENFNFTVTTSGKYPAWKPEQNNFTTDVLNAYKTIIPEVSLEAIHAGLECAIFKDKFKNIDIVSIGPNIYFPHSNRERCEISSVDKIYKIIKEIIKREKQWII